MKKFCLIFFQLILVFLVITAVATQLKQSSSNLILGLSFFTVQSNIIVGIVTAISLIFSPKSKGFRAFEGFSLMIILVTGIVYTAFLYPINRDWGSAAYGLVRTILHIAVPFLYLIIFCLSKNVGLLKLRYIFIWLLYPLIYAAVSFIVAKRLGFSLYYFFNVSSGYFSFIMKILGIVIIVIAVAFLVVILDRVILVKKKKV